MTMLLPAYQVPQARRPSRTAFVDGIRPEVDGWRAAGYPGVSPTTLRLLLHWFQTDHKVKGQPWNYYFCQREAIETLIYLFEVRQLRRMREILRTRITTGSSATLPRTATPATC
ncbi:MAG: hypothetical protein WEB00_13200 [Dehalococcoidia bacterium]